ncbi:MAG: histidine kinase [Flavobacteriaceae bacterium]
MLKQTGIYISRNLTNIGNTYLTLEKYKLAEEYYKEANLVSLEIDYQIGICNTYRGLAASLFFQKKYDEALKNALKSKELADKLKLMLYKRDINQLLADIYKSKGDYKNALISHQEYKLLSDSIFNKESIEKITQIEYEYKYKQAIDSANIRELKLTKTVLSTAKDLEKTQRNYLWAIIGVLLISIISGAAIFYQKLNNAKAITQNAIVEQKLLRSQMTPHFIFNSLAVLQGMILNKEEGKSVSYLSKFSKLLRLTLENSRDKMVLLSKELEALENYIQLQTLESDQINFSITLAEGIDPSTLKIPPMLIQPFVENAVEHAFKNNPKNRGISLNLSFQNADLTCTIMDNGVGIDAQAQTKNSTKTSLSTVINKERLQFLSKEFKMMGSLQIEDRKKYGEQGTIVTLVLPYQLETPVYNEDK